ncbi:purine/pyrimidine permease [Cytobacillus spongiae]|uniref:purine/pyrimidine permease n=1 Tax=Cytobacillus spongiae TaxID=2901381 RepID=UPI001F1E8879|nr:purine/pyrimidine permease [Cytobacillus spongiae]UII54138.1 purine/pyrimidine permease [Cytobacillus spongiae]
MKTGLSAIQWMAFMIAGTIVAPIAIAELYGLSAAETSGLVQRTMFVLGISSLLQGLIGHRLPINEGPAGLWWGVFVIYAGIGTTIFQSSTETLQALEGAMIISGMVFILFSSLKWIEKLATLFTPVVSGVYLLLLVLQLSGSFMNGMLGVGYRKEEVDLPIAGISFVVVLLAFYLSRHSSTLISQYSILICLSVGWCLMAIFKLSTPFTFPSDRILSFPKVFSFGMPVFETGMIITAIFVSLLLLTNMIASIHVVRRVLSTYRTEDRPTRVTAGGFVTGINQLLGGVFSAIGPVPISGAAGFIATTNISKLLPFLIGAAFVTISSFFPMMMSFFAALPTPIGYAVTFVVFTNMVGIAFGEIEKEANQSRIRRVIGVALLTGVGAMFVSSKAFIGIPPYLTALLNNGLILGTLMAIIIDQYSIRKEKLLSKV